jgi:4'-phosphopantetheinyl transferase
MPGARAVNSFDDSTNPPELRWPAADALLPPPAGGVAVWGAWLSGNARPTSAPAGMGLAAEEQARALKFLTAELRQRYVASRLVVRRLLGACLGLAPERVPIQSDARGKPHLEGGGFEFNLAHSGDLLLVAVAKRMPVGVDVERVRPLRDATAIARRFFTAREADWLETRSGAERGRAFFRLWTRKEAVLKATGEGISSGLNTIELLDHTGAFKDTVARGGGGVDATGWRLKELDPARGFIGALAWPAQAGPVEVLLRRAAPA